MKTFVKTIGILIIGILLSGCMVKKAATEVDEKAKSLIVPVDKALVYIVRPTGFGGAVRFKAFCDDKLIGSTSGMRFVYTVQDPGNHNFMSQAENKDELSIVLEANKSYYLEQQIKMGIVMARNKLVLLNETDGKQKLSKCKLSDDNVEK